MYIYACVYLHVYNISRAQAQRGCHAPWTCWDWRALGLFKIWRSIENLPKINPKNLPKSFQNHSDIRPKFTLGALLGLLGPLLGPLGAKRTSRKKNTENSEFRPPWLQFWEGWRKAAVRLIGVVFRYVPYNFRYIYIYIYIQWPCRPPATVPGAGLSACKIQQQTIEQTSQTTNQTNS